MTRAFGGLTAAMAAPGPAPDRAGELALFGRFVGSWELEWTGYLSDGTTARASGELHFDWALGGRAVQDVWIVPGPGEPGAGTPPLAFHGTTVRFYDRALDAWRSTWIDPVNGRVRRFIGRADGADIVLLSDEEAPVLRWTLCEIADDRFRWLGERSADGESWSLEDEMIATRRTTGGDDRIARA